MHTMVCLPRGAKKKKVSANGLIPVCRGVYIHFHHWFRKSFKFSVEITANTFVSQKFVPVHFYSCPQAKLFPRFLSLSLRQTGIAHFPWTAFSKDIFSWAEKGGGGRTMELKKLPKLTWALVTSLDKFHHLCNFYIFGLFCCAII